jgi:hypothetical protein
MHTDRPENREVCSMLLDLNQPKKAGLLVTEREGKVVHRLRILRPALIEMRDRYKPGVTPRGQNQTRRRNESLEALQNVGGEYECFGLPLATWRSEGCNERDLCQRLEGPLCELGSNRPFLQIKRNLTYCSHPDPSSSCSSVWECGPCQCQIGMGPVPSQ